MKQAIAVALAGLLVSCSSDSDQVAGAEAPIVDETSALQDDDATADETEDNSPVSAGATPELADAGLYNVVSIAADTRAAPDCVSQSVAFSDTWGDPQIINQYLDQSVDNATGDIIEFNYQCTLRVIYFTSESGGNSCAISGMNVTPEHWGLNPYELIEGC